ncbi:uncharacterized protein LOC128884518 [Hylaeus volcanicus]|uniref:uncharacterized protein LOC128884518 n=1 Tax=Hylaeus volcanicus TaxID=313075 RepID=UPI0023B7C8C8|nr:uncharacterized protein LOC128884518 [Hylaeus volcanicus]
MSISLKSKKPKTKKEAAVISSDEEGRMEVDTARVVLTPVATPSGGTIPRPGHSRTSSISSITEEVGTPLLAKRKRFDTSRSEIDSQKPAALLDEARKEREELEAYLFNDANKLTKSAIQFILSKWGILENRLQNEILEKEKLLVRNEEIKSKPTMTYAQVTSRGVGLAPPRVSTVGTPRKEKSTSQILIVKAVNDKDNRSSEELKNQVTQALESKRKDLRVRNIRQLRNKGVLLELESKKDVDIVKGVGLDGRGLSVAAPKKLDPVIVIYDVEKDLKPEELKEDLISKNLVATDDQFKEELKEKVIFRHSFKTSHPDRVNWIVQLPGKAFDTLLNSGRAYMFWRSYRLREYLNIARCFKCHMYGHVAKYCTTPKQLCEHCGQPDHAREDCKKKDHPQCPACVRLKRKDVDHSVRNKSCPEYLRQVEIYRNKVQWT